MEDPKIIFTSGNIKNEIDKLNVLINKKKNHNLYIKIFMIFLAIGIGINCYFLYKPKILLFLGIILISFLILAYILEAICFISYEMNNYIEKLDFLENVQNNTFRRYDSIQYSIVRYHYSEQGIIKLKSFTYDKEEIREDIEEDRLVFDNGKVIYQKRFRHY